VQDEIKKNKKITANSEQLAALKAQFPSCFDKDGRFRPDKLEDIVRASGADITREGYKLDWLGKSYARLLANLKTETLLAPNAEHNALPENAESENLLIQGDNLDVLKHLVNAYSEKVKMIYIDPPYNTGSDGFVYNDTRKFTVEELQRLAGVEEDEAQRILDFTQSSSNSHSAWLTFMYPRLYVARELLREDGVIFISIDDNEQSQLKLLCDEVFGEDNFVATLAVQLNPRGRNLDRFVAKTHEAIMIYTKSFGVEQAVHGLEKEGRMVDEYNKNDERGKHRLTGLRNRNQAFNPTTRPMLYYPLYVDPQNGAVSVQADASHNEEVWPDTDEGVKTCWTWGKEKAENERDLLVAENSGVGWRIFRKDYLLDENGRKASTLAKSVWLEKEINNDYGRKAVKDLLDGPMMSFPKAIALMQKVQKMGMSDDDLILDFFSGSGTTAHAVMALNARDGGNRKHISVQLDEPTDEKSEARKAGYATIFEITRERIKRAASKIKEDHPDATCDFGFKEFRTIPANEGPFQGYLDDAATRDDYVPFNGMALDDDAITALLTTWKAYDGLPLHQDLIPVDLDGYVAYQGRDKLYFVNSGLDIKHIVAMLTRIDDDPTFTPRKIVVFHYRFNDKQLREFSEAVNAQNRKHLQLDFIQRF